MLSYPYSRSQIVHLNELKHLKHQYEIIPCEDSIVHTHWSDHLELSIATNKTPKKLHWEEPEHLKHLNFDLK